MISNDLINSLILSLIGIDVAVFIFSVTLLGNAISKSEKEKKSEEEKAKTEFDTQIKQVAEELKLAKKSRDTTDLVEKITHLENNKKRVDCRIREITKRYSLITFRGSIAYTVSFLISALIVNNLATNLTEPFGTLVTVMSIVLIVFGVARIYKILRLIEEVSISSDSFQIEKMKGAFHDALTSHEKDKECILGFKTRNLQGFKVDINAKIDFILKLSRGNMAENVSLLFFLPKDLEAIRPSDTWRQDEDFPFPDNKKSVQIDIGKIIKGVDSIFSLEVKSQKTGKHQIYYKIISSNSADSIRGFTINID